MSNPSKQKGTAWETAIVEYLKDSGFDARRKPLSGSADEGDISVEELPWLCVEAKAGKAYDLAGWVEEANAEAVNAQARVGVVWVKRRGKTAPGAGYVIMDGESFVETLVTICGLHEALREGWK